MTAKMKRILIHIPVGLANAFIALVSGWLGLVFGLSFLSYEITEEWRIKDKGWRDLQGFLIGIVIGAAVWGLMEWLL